MPRFIGFICNDDSLTSLAVSGLHQHVDFPATADSGGFGFGWIQDGRSLLRTSPKPGGGVPEFVDLMADIPARVIVGHLRDAEDGMAPTLDLQPFRFRRWVFSHLGEVPEMAETREELLEPVPEFVRSNIKGSSGSEVIGHVFLGELHRRGLLEKGRDSKGRAEALATVAHALQSKAAIASFAAIAATERSLFAAAMGEPLYYREIRGLDEDPEDPLFAGHKPKKISHPTFKALVVTSAPSDAEEWETVPDRHVLWIDRDWETRTVPIGA